jgi:hypothetical protein
MKRYTAEIIIDDRAEEQALARLVARMNESSPTPLSVEEALASVLYDIVLSDIPRCSAGFVIEDAPLAVGALLDEAHEILVVSELLQAMTLTSEVLP